MSQRQPVLMHTSLLSEITTLSHLESSQCVFDFHANELVLQNANIDLKTLSDFTHQSTESSLLKSGGTYTPSFSSLKILPIFVKVQGGEDFTQEQLDHYPKLLYDLPGLPNNYSIYPRVKKTIERDSYGQATILGPLGEPGSMDTFVGPFTVSDWHCPSRQDLIDELDPYVDFSPILDGARFVIFTPTMMCSPASGRTSLFEMTSEDFAGESILTPSTMIHVLNTGTWLHELGHGFGAGHSGRAECEDEFFHDIPYSINTDVFYGTEECMCDRLSILIDNLGLNSALLPIKVWIRS